MSTTKWVMLAIYLVMVCAAVVLAGTRVSSIIVWTFIALAVIHLLEFAVKLRALRNAGGSLLNHFIHTLLFGIVHWRPLERR